MPGVDASPGAPAEPPRARPAASPPAPSGRLLTGLFVGRLALATLVVVLAGLGWTTRPEAAFLLVTAVLLSLLPAVYAWWRATTRRIRPGPALLLGQSLADLTLVAVLSSYAGPDQPAIVALFVLLIAIYALLLPLIPGGMMVAGAIAAYSISVTQAPGIEVDAAFWGQIVVFLAVYATVAYLGRLLQAAEAGQSALETELRRVRLEAEDILQNISAGILTVDGTGRLGFINPTAEELLGLDGQSLLGGPVLETLRERSPELHAAIDLGIGEGRRLSRAEGIVNHPDGRRFPIGLSTTTFSRPDERLPAVTAIFSDISDLERLKGLHQRAERLEAVAELSASLAHEIRNPLASIRSSVEQLARSAQADADDRFLGKLIVRESDRLSRLLTEFLDFSRVRVARFETVDLHGLALEAAEVVRGHPDCVDRIVIAVRGAPAPLQGDSDLLHRVAVNLILNAVQSVAGAGTRGRVEVTVDRPDPEGLPLGRDFLNPVRLRVTDDGPGIDPEMKDRLFAPFASGRPGGTGLGLAIVQRAVEAHRGLVFVDSVPGSGTTFTIYLHTRRPSQEIA